MDGWGRPSGCKKKIIYGGDDWVGLMAPNWVFFLGALIHTSDTDTDQYALSPGSHYKCILSCLLTCFRAQMVRQRCLLDEKVIPRKMLQHKFSSPDVLSFDM